MAQPLSRWERIVWIASWVAPLALWGAFILFGLVVAWPSLRGDARLHAWLIGAIVLLALVAHVLVWRHGTTAEHFSSEERSGLAARLRRAGGHGHWRTLMTKHQRTWYKGHSHTGGRPRFD
jgi:hypothetical protein